MTAPEGLHIDIDGRPDGRTVVLSHGVGSEATVWDGWVPVLGGAYRLVRWDQPGHGRSPHVAPDAYGAKLAYDSLRSVVGDTAGVVLVGHSLGGYLSCRFTIEHPGQVAALVLVATGPGFRSPDAMAKWNTDIGRQAQKAGRPEMLVGLHEDSLVMDHLADITCPSMVLVGAEDAPFLGATDYIERKVPGIERHTIEGATHAMPGTHAEQLATMVGEFLARRLPSN